MFMLPKLFFKNIEYRHVLYFIPFYMIENLMIFFLMWTFSFMQRVPSCPITQGNSVVGFGKKASLTTEKYFSAIFFFLELN